MAVTTIDHVLATRVLNVLQRGVKQGALTTQAERSANRAAFQAAIDEATTNGYILYVPAGEYNIELQALKITANATRWLGTVKSTIIQHTLNIPAVHVGPPIGSVNTVTSVLMDGAELRYNGTGSAGANALELTGIWMSDLRNFDIGDVYQPVGSRTSVPWCGVWCDSTTGTAPLFSVQFSNFRIKHFGWRGFSATRDDSGGAGASTQNVLQNFYISGGQNYTSGVQDISAVSNSAMAAFSGHSQLTIVGFNTEWCKTVKAVSFVSCNEVDFVGFNCEGVQLARTFLYKCGFVELYDGRLAIRGATFYNCRGRVADNVDVGSAFLVGPSSRLKYENIRIDLHDTTGTTTVITNCFDGSDDNVHIDAGHVILTSSANVARWDAFVFATPGSGSLYGQLTDFNNSTPYTTSDADQTHYTYNTPGVQRVPCTANRNFTLKKAMSASKATIIPRGVARRIRHVGGAGTLSVKNDAGATIGTLASGFYMDAYFDSQTDDWVAG